MLKCIYQRITLPMGPTYIPTTHVLGITSKCHIMVKEALNSVTVIKTNEHIAKFDMRALFLLN